MTRWRSVTLRNGVRQLWRALQMATVEVAYMGSQFPVGFAAMSLLRPCVYSGAARSREDG